MEIGLAGQPSTVKPTVLFLKTVSAKCEVIKDPVPDLIASSMHSIYTRQCVETWKLVTAFELGIGEPPEIPEMKFDVGIARISNFSGMYTTASNLNKRKEPTTQRTGMVSQSIPNQTRILTNFCDNVVQLIASHQHIELAKYASKNILVTSLDRIVRTKDRFFEAKKLSIQIFTIFDWQGYVKIIDGKLCPSPPTAEELEQLDLHEKFLKIRAENYTSIKLSKKEKKSTLKKFLNSIGLGEIKLVASISYVPIVYEKCLYETPQKFWSFSKCRCFRCHSRQGTISKEYIRSEALKEEFKYDKLFLKILAKIYDGKEYPSYICKKCFKTVGKKSQSKDILEFCHKCTKEVDKRDLKQSPVLSFPEATKTFLPYPATWYEGGINKGKHYTDEEQIEIEFLTKKAKGSFNTQASITNFVWICFNLKFKSKRSKKGLYQWLTTKHNSWKPTKSTRDELRKMLG